MTVHVSYMSESESESEMFTGETPNRQSFTRGCDLGKLVPSSHKRGEDLRHVVISYEIIQRACGEFDKFNMK